MEPSAERPDFVDDGVWCDELILSSSSCTKIDESSEHAVELSTNDASKSSSDGRKADLFFCMLVL